jgi:SAM-dependent methyltransferase
VTAEFDRHAAGYDGGFDNPLKRLAGASPDQFTAVKVRWLLEHEPALASGGLDLLDYGCGAGDLLRVLAEHGAQANFTGCDVSAGMLEEARRRWPQQLAPMPSLVRHEGPTPFAAGAFDVAIASALLHHVPPAERAALYGEFGRVLRPGGRLYVFEHNPNHPLVRYVVARTPIDRGAVLLAAAEVRQALPVAGFSGVSTQYLMILPPRITLLRGLDRALSRLPLGAQYVVAARKPAPVRSRERPA